MNVSFLCWYRMVEYTEKGSNEIPLLNQMKINHQIVMIGFSHETNPSHTGYIGNGGSSRSFCIRFPVLGSNLEPSSALESRSRFVNILCSTKF